jgi:hypothetical protein
MKMEIMARYSTDTLSFVVTNGGVYYGVSDDTDE